MTLDQSALRDLFAELKLTDVPDRIRLATETLCQSQIDAEATSFIGAAPFRAVPEDPSRRPPCYQTYERWTERFFHLIMLFLTRIDNPK